MARLVRALLLEMGDKYYKEGDVIPYIYDSKWEIEYYNCTLIKINLRSTYEFSKITIKGNTKDENGDDEWEVHICDIEI